MQLNEVIELLLENSDYYVHLVPFPPGMTDGFCSVNKDGTYTISIDANATRERQLAALQHELDHLEDGDLYSKVPVSELEFGRKGASKPEKIDSVSEKSTEKCAKSEEKTIEKCATLEQRAEAWASSWANAMMWAETMKSLYGESDLVPLYRP